VKYDDIVPIEKKSDAYQQFVKTVRWSFRFGPKVW
jgi:hypothetical protein